MTHRDFEHLKMAQGDLREALHALDAIASRSRGPACRAIDLDRILQHVEASLSRLRTLRASLDMPAAEPEPR